MLKVNEAIVHEDYGAGRVTGYRVIRRSGKNRRYCCIELVEGRGTLMIPQKNIDQSPVRAATKPSVIRAEIKKPPEELTDNHISRRGKIQTMLNSGKPRQVARALRDLHWRGQHGKLTDGDRKLKDSAFKLLVEELSLHSTTQAAQETVQAMLDKMTQMHPENA